MSDLANFLESTYLKEFNHNDLSDLEHIKNINLLVNDAILYGIKLVMIHPKNIKMVRKTLDKKSSSVLIGTVIDFPFGNKAVEIKKNEALSAILDGADELDFVINYELFKRGDYEKVSEEVVECISLCINNSKTIKWIIEIAALSNEEIIGLMKGVTIVAKKLGISSIDGKGYRALANISDYGGQEVPHLHFHLFGGEKVGKMVS